MSQIIIIGEGNVGVHLARAFGQAGEDVALLSARRFTPADIPADAKVAIIAVPDAHIAECASRLTDFQGIVAHTSGGAGLDVLLTVPKSGRAVFYPLQTFTKDAEMDYSEIPFFIEAEDPATAEILKTLARRISPNVREADSVTRCRMHIAAVFACNFTNHLWTLSCDYLRRYGLAFDDLLPLLRQTMDKIQKSAPDADPAEMQTGPAVRNDRPTIERHLKMLKDHPGLSAIYRTLTESIIDVTNQKRDVKN